MSTQEQADREFIKQELNSQSVRWGYYVEVRDNPNYSECSTFGVPMESCRKWVGPKFEERVKAQVGYAMKLTIFATQEEAQAHGDAVVTKKCENSSGLTPKDFQVCVFAVALNCPRGNWF